MNKFDELPPDMLMYLALTMDLPELLNMCNASKRFNSYTCSSGNFWERKLLNDYNVPKNKIPTTLSPKAFYAMMYRGYDVLISVFRGFILPNLITKNKVTRDMVEFLLSIDGVDEGIKQTVLNQSLINATRENDRNYVRFLLENGADANYKNGQALDVAYEKNLILIPAILKKHMNRDLVRTIQTKPDINPRAKG